MKVLITGGYGFIGSNFVRYLYDKYPDIQIWNVDLLTYAGNPDNLADIEKREKNRTRANRRYRFTKGDIADRGFVHTTVAGEQFDCIFNFAAESHVDRSITNSVHFIRTNVQGTHTLLDAARLNKTPLFIHISTDEIYGDRKRGSADEKTRLAPSNPYSASKASADLLAQSYVRTYNMPVTIIRGSNNFGPYQYPEKLVPLAITNLLQNKKIPIHGDGTHIRSWLYVEDFCGAIDRIWQKARPQEIYNVGGVEKSNIQIVRDIANILGHDPLHMTEHVSDRPGQDIRYSIDYRKLQKDVEWKHAYSYEKGLQATVDWYLKERKWSEKIKNTKTHRDHMERQSKGIWF